MPEIDYNKEFELFCVKYGLEYDFTRLGEYSYISYETVKAFKLWSFATLQGV